MPVFYSPPAYQYGQSAVTLYVPDMSVTVVPAAR